MGLEHLLARIERVADIIQMDAKNPDNRSRAWEIKKLVELAKEHVGDKSGE